MRNTLKAATLESKFPLLSVEQGCIISKDADITIAFKVSLPELFTVTSEEYEAIHSVWNKAVKVLPDYYIVHKQDWYIQENYRSENQEQDLSFLSSSFERHFNERPYLNHTCYLFLTKTTKERSRQRSNFNSLSRGFILPKEIKNKETIFRFVEAVNQFEQIINDSESVRDEYTKTLISKKVHEKDFDVHFAGQPGFPLLPVLSACGFVNGTWASFVSLRLLTKPWRSLQQCIAAIPAGAVCKLATILQHRAYSNIKQNF